MTHTEEQRAVFQFVKSGTGHGIIDAVAGSGKTTTIVDSASYIDSSKRVLFCAFNKGIAREISTRFSLKGLNTIQVKTLHALGFDILKTNSPTEYKIDNQKYNKLIETALKHNQFAELIEELLALNRIPINPVSTMEVNQQKSFLNSARQILIDTTTKFRLTLTREDKEDFKSMLIHFNIFNEKKTAVKYFEEESAVYFELTKAIIEKGNQVAEKLHTIDFSDMLYLPYIKNLTPIHKVDFLFIDECQDLSKSQLAVALKYVKREGRVLSVGDPSQSIYGFTGADIESFDKIKTTLPNTATLTLSQCFRCPNNIIELAREFRKDIHPFGNKEGNIQFIEADQVIDIVKPNNLIICRIKAPLEVLMYDLIEKNIPVEVHEDEVKEFMNDLRFLFIAEELRVTNIFKDDNKFFDRVAERNISFMEKKSFKLKDKESKEAFIKEETNLIESKISFLKKQLSIHIECKTINDLLLKIERLIAGGRDAIKLSTIHRAKGLENDTIFILDYDRLPLYRDSQKDWERKQENNLKYVALTRSKKNLFLVKSMALDIDDDNSSLFDTISNIW